MPCINIGDAIICMPRYHSIRVKPRKKRSLYFDMHPILGSMWCYDKHGMKCVNNYNDITDKHWERFQYWFENVYKHTKQFQQYESEKSISNE